jgi:ribosomal protein S13
MGFNKRYIRKETIVSIYERDGIEGLKRYFTADALIVEGGIDTDAIVKCLTEDDTDKLEELVNNLTENC